MGAAECKHRGLHREASACSCVCVEGGTHFSTTVEFAHTTHTSTAWSRPHSHAHKCENFTAWSRSHTHTQICATLSVAGALASSQLRLLRITSSTTHRVTSQAYPSKPTSQAHSIVFTIPMKRGCTAAARCTRRLCLHRLASILSQAGPSYRISPDSDRPWTCENCVMYRHEGRESFDSENQ